MGLAHKGAGGDHRLLITEVFLSLQGEGDKTGWPTTFIRLTGCPLRCSYCDTTYAFTGGEWIGFDELMERVGRNRVSRVCVTGGEPLAQKGCLPLLTRLCDTGFSVSLETSGALEIANVDPRVSRNMDLKTPSSGAVERNLYTNIDHLTPTDLVKFVICDRQDYAWMRTILDKYRLHERCGVMLSPCHGLLEPRELAAWIISDRLEARLQLQLHKLIWGDEPGR